MRAWKGRVNGACRLAHRLTPAATSRLFRQSLSAAIPFFVAVSLADAAGAREARETISEWVALQQTLSGERAAWREEKAALSRSIELLEAESRLLDERIAELSDTAAETERRHKELTSRNERFLASAERSVDRLGELENELRGLRPIFPMPLETRAAPLFERLEAAGDRPLPHRLQTLLALLGEIDDFQRAVTVSREVRDLGDGRRREVQTVYLGLGHAFFVDDEGSIAGTGLPGPDGWRWARDDSIARQVNRAIAILENRRPAEFIDLPVILKEDLR